MMLVYEANNYDGCQQTVDQETRTPQWPGFEIAFRLGRKPIRMSNSSVQWIRRSKEVSSFISEN